MTCFVDGNLIQTGFHLNDSILIITEVYWAKKERNALCQGWGVIIHVPTLHPPNNSCNFFHRVGVIGRSRRASTSILHNTSKINYWSTDVITLPWRMLWCSRWGWPHRVNLWFLDKFLPW